MEQPGWKWLDFSRWRGRPDDLDARPPNLHRGLNVLLARAAYNARPRGGDSPDGEDSGEGAALSACALAVGSEKAEEQFLTCH